MRLKAILRVTHAHSHTLKIKNEGSKFVGASKPEWQWFGAVCVLLFWLHSEAQVSYRRCHIESKSRFHGRKGSARVVRRKIKDVGKRDQHCGLVSVDIK